MNLKSITKHYNQLEPSERFRLMVAAGARGDRAEQERLSRTGGRIHLIMRDDGPWLRAWEELSTLVYVEVLEEAGKYQDAYQCLDEEEIEEASRSPLKGRLAARYLDLLLAQGFLLRTKVAGWELFCERQSIPPYTLWETLPGYDRLMRAFKMCEGDGDAPAMAFVPEGMARFLNDLQTRHDDQDHTSDVRIEALITPEQFAGELAEIFDERVQWWGG